MICTKCTKDKHYSEFTVNKHNVSGYSYNCRSCVKEKYGFSKKEDIFTSKVKNYKDYLKADEERRGKNKI